jgi:AcrR family transcriptional regulator
MAVRSKEIHVRARQEKARERARQEILAAAAGVFARRGYAAATLADLAEAAGYAAPSLYRYFESKEEIFRSLLDQVKADLGATFAAPVDRSLPLAARLEALLAAQFALVRSRSDVFAVLAYDNPVDLRGKPALAELRAGLSLYEGALAAWMRRHVAPGELRCSIEDASRALAGVSHAFHHCTVGAPGSPAAPADLVHLLVDLALNGIQAQPARGSLPPAEEST